MKLSKNGSLRRRNATSSNLLRDQSGLALDAPDHHGGDDRDRTGDLRLAKPSLSQLSYVPRIPQRLMRRRGIHSPTVGMVGLSGVEPLTSRLSGARSNQLSYRPTDIVPAVMRPGRLGTVSPLIQSAGRRPGSSLPPGNADFRLLPY